MENWKWEDEEDKGISNGWFNFPWDKIVDMSFCFWKNDIHVVGVKYVDKVLDVGLEERCFILGMVYVENPLKPSILNELSQEVPSHFHPIVHFIIITNCSNN